MSRIGLIVLAVVVTGCAIETLRWYQPSGTGVAEERHCGGPKEVMSFRLNEAGTILKISIEPAHRDKQLGRTKPTVIYSMTLGPNTSVRIADPVLVVLSPEGAELSQYRFKTLNAPGFKSVAATTQLQYDAHGPNSANPRLAVLDNHYSVFITLDNLPERFHVRYPRLIISGTQHSGQVVFYASSEGSFLLHRCLTGT